MTNIRLHGYLGEEIGAEWNLNVKSVGESLRAIEVLSKRKLYKRLIENDRKGIRYKVLINGRNFESDGPLYPDDIQKIKDSELAMLFENLETIDIVPVLEGARDAVLIILGIVLVVVGLYTGNYALVLAGIGLVAAGVSNLLSSPPKFEDFREVKGGGSTSYLFNGPQNTTREGGPVPIGYGRLIVGSQVIAASYEIVDRLTRDNPITI